jgi:hypothetical protein
MLLQCREGAEFERGHVVVAPKRFVDHREDGQIALVAERVDFGLVLLLLSTALHLNDAGVFNRVGVGHDAPLRQNKATAGAGGLRDPLPRNDVVGFTVRAVNFQDRIENFGEFIVLVVLML